MDWIEREEAELADARERAAEAKAMTSPSFPEHGERRSVAAATLSPEGKRFRKEYLAWRMRGGKPADKPKREKLEIVKPSAKPFCVFGDNGETKTTLGPFPSCVAVYALLDPRDNTVRYVGKTTCPELRLREHIESAGNQSRRCRWIADLVAHGMEPTMVILDRVSAARWEHVERRWIAFYSRRGSLYNVEIGGAGYLHEELDKRRQAKG